MAEFNAGSIIGSLDISLDPFQAGLDRAAVEADEFAAKHGVNTNADIDTSRFDEGVAGVKAETDALSKDKAEVKVDADTTAATAKMALFKHSVDSASGAEGGGGHGMLYLLGLAASLAPAFAPAIAAAGLFGSAAIAGMAQAGVGLGAFLAVAKSDFAQLQAAIKAGTQLKGPAGEAETALKQFHTAWKEVQKDTAGPVFGVMTTAFRDAAAFLPKIEPLVVAVAKGLEGAVGTINKWIESPGFQQFLNMVRKDAIPDIKEMATVLVNFGTGFINLIEGLNPVTQLFVGGLGKVSGEFKSWSEQMKNGGITQVFAYIKQYGPEVGQLLHGVFTLLGSLGRGLAPLVGPALVFLNALVGALGHINITPLATALGGLLTVLGPVMTMLGGLINVILPPLSKLIGVLVTSFIGPLVNSLGTQLTPVLSALGGFLDALVVPLGTFLASIANLVNPTGVGFLSTLLVGLITALTPLIDPVFALATALEGLVDDGIAMIVPLLPGLVGGLTAVTTAIGPVIGWLAKLISYKPIADMLVSMAAGAWAMQKAMVALGIIKEVVQWIKEMELASVAETVALKAMYAWDVLVSAATKAWEIIQIVMDGVMAIFDAELWTAVGAEILAAAPFILIAAGVALLIVGIVELVKHWSTVWGWITKIGDYLGGAFAAAWKATMHFFANIGKDIAGFFVGAGKWLYNIGSDIIHGLLKGIEFYAQIMYDFYIKLPLKILSYLKNPLKWLLQAGIDIFTGLWNGMKQVWDKLTGWITAAAKKISDIFGAVLKFGSPSKVMHQLGVWTAQGYGDGFAEHWDGTVLPSVALSVAKLKKALAITGQGTQDFTVSSQMARDAATEAALHDLIQQMVELRQSTTELPALIGVAVGEPFKTAANKIAKASEENHNSVKEAFVMASNSSTDKIISAVRKR